LITPFSVYIVHKGTMSSETSNYINPEGKGEAEAGGGGREEEEEGGGRGG
jgi:hypothetical protein